MSYEKKYEGIFLDFWGTFSGCNFDTLFSTAPSKTLTGTHF